VSKARATESLPPAGMIDVKENAAIVIFAVHGAALTKK
jgi:hypothetical protein